MKVLAIILLSLLPTITAQADCGRLKANDDYEKLNKILECLDSRITELQKRVALSASSGSEKAISEEKPVSGKEIEPNDHISQATPIALGTTTRGRLKKEEQDYYKFKVPEGYDGNVRVICRQLSTSYSVLQVQVQDSVEKIVASGIGGVGMTVSFAFSPEANSTYFIMLGWPTGSSSGLDYELVIKKE